MTRETIDRPAHFLVENGILFEINRQVLHPLGLQLELELEPDGTACQLVLEDNRGVPLPIAFTSEEFEEGRARYEAYMREHGRRNLQKRHQIGMVIQTGPNLTVQIRERDPADGGTGSAEGG